MKKQCDPEMQPSGKAQGGHGAQKTSGACKIRQPNGYINLGMLNWNHFQSKPQEGRMWWIAIWLPLVRAKDIIGFNCNLKDRTTYSEVSLLNVKQCENTTNMYEPGQKSRVQLIQRIESEYIEIMNCELKLTFYIAYCGMGLYSRVWNQVEAATDYPVRITRSQCAEAFISNTLKFFDHGEFGGTDKTMAIDLEQDRTASGVRYIRGTEVMNKNTCTGESFPFQRRTFNNHILKMKYKAEIKMVTGILSHRSRRLKLNDRISTLRIQEGAVFDSRFGNFFFSPIYLGNTSTNEYAQIARGDLVIHHPANVSTTQPIAVIQPTDRMVGQQLTVLLKESLTICIVSKCSSAYSTHLQGVYLLQIKVGEGYYNLNDVPISDINQFTDIRATMGTVYLNEHLKLADTFEKLSTELCKQSRRHMMADIQSYVASATGRSNSERGKHLILSGSMAYVVHCQEMIVQLRTNISECYANIPVEYYNNDTHIMEKAFLHPTSYNLMPTSMTQVCSEIIPTKFGIMTSEDTVEWICYSPLGWSTTPNCLPPPELNPLFIGTIYTPETHKLDIKLYNEKQLNSIHRKQWENDEEATFNREFGNALNDKAGNEKTRAAIRDMVTQVISEASDTIQGFVMPNLFKVIIWIWNKMAVLVVLTFFINMCMRIITMVGRAKKIYKQTGTYSWRMLCAITNGLFLIMLPVKQDCRCREDEFLEELITELRKREQQELLNRIYQI